MKNINKTFGKKNSFSTVRNRKNSDKVEDNRKEIWALSQHQSAMIDEFSNPNILLNGNFAINQRGQSSYSSNAAGFIYTVDRWCLPKFYNITCTPQSNIGVKVACTNLSSHTVFAQIVNMPGYYSGKTVTFSLKYQDLVGQLALKIVDGSSSTTTLFTNKAKGKIFITTTLSSNCSNLVCEIVKGLSSEPNFSVKLLEAKLEIGNYATNFSPRPYQEELELCEKYYLNIVGHWTRLIRYNTDTLSFMLPVSLRITPILNINSYYIQGYSSYSNNYDHYTSGFNIELGNHLNTGIRFFATKTNHNIYDGIVYLSCTLDAEIY